MSALNRHFTQFSKALILLGMLLIVNQPKEAHAVVLPMVNISWDGLLGLNVGLGAAVGGDVFIGMEGGYVCANKSLVNSGLSVSTGHYMTIAGLYTTRVGASMYKLPFDGLYIGAEHSLTITAGYYRSALLIKANKGDGRFFKANVAAGLGLF